MVNCKNCGAPLSLEQAVCPHCGTENPEAIAHLKKLAQLNRDFKEAKIEVDTEVKKSKRGYGLLVLLVMVLIANIVLFGMHAASYSIADSIRASKYDKQQIGEKLEGYLANGDYDRFAKFYEAYVLSYSDFPQYRHISSLAYQYTYLKKYVSSYFNSENRYSDPLVYACRSISDFENDRKNISRWADEETDMDEINKLIADYELYLKTFLKLTDEDIAQMSSMSESELLIMVSGRLNDEKE